MDGAINPPQHQDVPCVGSVWDKCGVRFQHRPPPALLPKARHVLHRTGTSGTAQGHQDVIAALGIEILSRGAVRCFALKAILHLS